MSITRGFLLLALCVFSVTCRDPSHSAESGIISVPSADLFWERKGEPSLIDAEILDSSGDPIRDAELAFVTASGGNLATSDRDGKCKVHVSEIRLVKIRANRTVLFDKVSLPLENGLRLRIVLKGSIPIKKTPVQSTKGKG